MSARRLNIVLAAVAWDELSDILQYSVEHWGVEQRSAYASLIRSTLDILAQTPHIGRSRSELSKDLRSQPVGSHIVYYWVTDSSIVVAHILHNRREPARENWTPPDDE